VTLTLTLTHKCPALLVAAPASGQGKTTVTAGLARLMTLRGHKVRVFKCGPDFLDPHWHALASNSAVHNLDLWLNGEEDIRARLNEAAAESDLILIEGVMGLFDGDPSAADLAQRLGISVLAVIDASAMAGTFGALVHGLRYYRPHMPWAGVMANCVASDAHLQMLRQSLLPDVLEAANDMEIGWLGALRRDAEFSLPERNLGLTLASELPDAMKRLDHLAKALSDTPIGKLELQDWQRWAVDFEARPMKPVDALLKGVKLAVAQDAAFCFIYQANLDTLKALGAELVFFSPLSDQEVPPCDAVWLPGGYPELHLEALMRAQNCRSSLLDHVSRDKPVWAECGGMMPLFDAITLLDGSRSPMWGLMPGEVSMKARLSALGPHQWVTKWGELRGHTFHFSLVDTPLVPVGHTQATRQFGKPEAIYSKGSLKGSYFHAWFASNPESTAHLFLPESR